MKRNWPIVFLILGTIIFNGSVFLPYAKPVYQGIKLYGTHYNDGVNNIALINSLQYSIPPQNPNFSGMVIKNYHYFINLILAVIQNVTHLDLFVLYFGLAPIFMIFVLSLLSYFYVRMYVGRFAGSMAILFANFLGNYYYLGYFIGSHNINSSIAWIDEYSTRITNYQLLSSYIVILLILICIKRNKSVFIIGLMSGLLLGFKVYAWILWELSLIIYGSFIFFIKKEKKYLPIIIWSLLFSFLVGSFLFKQNSSGFPFSFRPLWLIKSMFESSDRFAFPQWELMRQTFLENKNYFAIGKLYSWGILAFLIINFGPKIIGLIFAGKEEIQIIKIMILIGIIVPLLFSQSSGSSWNIVQFGYYSIFFLSILIAMVIPKLYPYFSPVLCSAFILISIPSAIVINDSYLHPPYVSGPSYELITALQYLHNQSYGVVLSHPDFNSNAIVSAISSKPLFLGDRMILESYGIDTTVRLRQEKDFFSGSMLDPKMFLIDNNIKYIVSPIKVDISQYELKMIYSNEYVSIYTSL